MTIIIADAYEAIARNVDDLVHKGAVASATGTTIESTTLIHPLSGQLKGYEFYIYSGGGSGQYKKIIDFDPINDRITIQPAFTTIPSTNAKFLIFEKYGVEDYENALNRAMGIAKLKHLDEMSGTLELVGSQYEYNVPSGMEFINTLRLVPSSGSDYSGDDEVNRLFELAPRYWRIEKNYGGTYQIIFDSRQVDMDTIDGELVKVMGQGKPDLSSTTLPEDLQEYLIAYSSMLLAGRKIKEGTEWQTKYTVYKDAVDRLEPYIHTSRRGKKVG